MGKSCNSGSFKSTCYRCNRLHNSTGRPYSRCTPVVGYTDDLASAGGLVAGITKYCNFSLAELDKEIDAENGLLLNDAGVSDDELDTAFEAAMEDDGE